MFGYIVVGNCLIEFCNYSSLLLNQNGVSITNIILNLFSCKV